MTAIGVDTHKATLAACAVDELGRPVDEAAFANDPAGHEAFIDWARSVAPQATIGIEGSSSFGAPLARSVEAAGLSVREVPPHLSRAERRRTRRPGKSDPADALAIARVGRLLRGNHTVQAELARALLTRLPRLEREIAGLRRRIGTLASRKRKSALRSPAFRRGHLAC